MKKRKSYNTEIKCPHCRYKVANAGNFFVMHTQKVLDDGTREGSCPKCKKSFYVQKYFAAWAVDEDFKPF